jgi:AcrR family transcriptional regulator
MEAKLQRQQALSDARRELVLDAARAVFEEHGIDGASIREIAKRAGYTPGAIYTYFESKEAIYAVLLEESLDRLQTSVEKAKLPKSSAEKASEADLAGRNLSLKANAWFDFYMQNPRDLDLGFYIAHGLRPRGLSPELNTELNRKLHAALAPCEEAMLKLGLSPEQAVQENTALFAHGVGLLLLHHTGRIRMFNQSGATLFDKYVQDLRLRLTGTSPEPVQEEDPEAEFKRLQADLFG